MAVNHEKFSHENSYHTLIYIMNLLREVMTLYRHVFHMFSYNFDTYLLITAQIRVHDS